ncbi:hypothetical protein K469DRAFT_607773, partial [Zopfia rhizophila CBS 207.26]
PVRSPLNKPLTGGLVVRWVTTSEYPLLYVFCLSFLFQVTNYMYRVMSPANGGKSMMSFCKLKGGPQRKSKVGEVSFKEVEI